MDIWHILTIILFTTQIVSGILCNGNTVEINFLVRMFWVIIWNIIYIMVVFGLRKVVMKMYKWIMEYLNLFKQDFPFSAVADLNEYEIIRIIQDCVKNNRIYTAETKVAVIGTGKIGQCIIGKEE